LRRYGSLQKLLAAGRFAAEAKQLRLFRSIATMNQKAPLPRIRDQNPTWQEAAALAKTWRLDQLSVRLDAMRDATISGR
jgi:hypothetical protein